MPSELSCLQVTVVVIFTSCYKGIHKGRLQRNTNLEKVGMHANNADLFKRAANMSGTQLVCQPGVDSAADCERN